MTEQTLWNQFNLQGDNLDQGAGILYCLRYDAERIKGHQEAIVSALESTGIIMEDKGEGIEVKLPEGIDKSGRHKIIILLEELSCLNMSMEYVNAGFSQYNSVLELCDGLKTQYFHFLKNKSIVDTYDFITLTIPEIVRDLRLADRQNKVLSSKDRKELSDLTHFAKRQDDVLNGRYVILG